MLIISGKVVGIVSVIICPRAFLLSDVGRTQKEIESALQELEKLLRYDKN